MATSSSKSMIAAGGDVDLAAVCVRVAGDSLDPVTVSSDLGAEPTFAAKKGARRKSGKSFVSQSTGVWLISEEVLSGKDLGSAIRRLLGRMSDQPSIWDRLADSYQLDLMCGLFLDDWNRGLEIEPDVLEMLGSRHLALSLDIYSHHDRRVRQKKGRK